MINITKNNLFILRKLFPNLKRALGSIPIETEHFSEHRSLVVEKYGKTENVALKVQKSNEVLPKELQPNQILVEHLLSCVNPADINMIQGVYGIKPEIPFVPGNEGVVRVKQVGTMVKHLRKGSLAIPVPFVGCWQSYSVQDSDKFYELDDGLDLVAACQLKSNPPSAYRMLKDYVQLKPGDCVIQNGANSAVGTYVIQLAKHWDLKTINVIRDRPNKQQVVNELKELGADVIVTEEELSSAEVMTPIINTVGKPKLLLNCVGGNNANNCARLLAFGAQSITYGAMSRQPFSPTASSLIFKQHKYVGIWVSKWFEDRQETGRQEIKSLLDELAVMFKSGILKPKNAQLIEFEDRNIAFDMSSSANKKYLFSINKAQ